jgi:carboxymethylenebutenolidase
LFDYPGEDHGFAAEMGKRRSEAAAQLADARTAVFFAKYLG